ncbi:hypothetical protein EAI_04159, partial [Harpegnathos saltator]
EPYYLTITGIVRKNKPEIPAQLKLASKTIPDTKFCFSKEIVLLSHIPKKNKIAIVASSYSKTTEVTNGKPNIIIHYNKTKGGTDSFDQLCHAYTVTKRTNRWPMRYFFDILDQAALNTRILLNCLRQNLDQNKIRAKYSLEDLSLHLITPYLRSRINNPSLCRDLRIAIGAILDIDEVESKGEERPYLPVKTRCGLCERKTDRKTKELCPSCRRPMCNTHRVYMCVEC